MSTPQPRYFIAGSLLAIVVFMIMVSALWAQDGTPMATADTNTASQLAAQPVAVQPIAAPIFTDAPETAGAVVVTTTQAQFAPNQLLFKVQAVTAPAQTDELRAATVMQSLAQLVPDSKVINITPLFAQSLAAPIKAAQADPALSAEALQAITQSGLDRIYLLTVQGDVTAIAAALQANPAIEYVQPNYIRHAVAVPNDTLYPQMWALTNVQAANAWNVATGNGVLVAVIDTGVALTHPDLQGNIYSKPGEIAGNGLDDDGNGFIDDVNGWDFANNDNNPSDGHGHGSHVAGTIAAVGNNNRGVIGLAYQSRILPIKGLSDSGSGYDADLANAILYAVNNGAKVINNSWGGGGYSPLFEDVVNYAHANNVVVVSAAGNDNQNACAFTPANVENSITVAAVGPTDVKASYSNFGVKVDVAAPGGSNLGQISEDILSTVPTGAFSWAPVVTGPNGEEYRSIAGTSMAAPHVAALAALILQLHPTWTPEQVRQVIRQSSNDSSTPGFDPQSGYGRINAQQAVNWSNTPPPSAAIRWPRNCTVVSNAVAVKGIASTTSIVTYTVDIGIGETPATFVPVYTGSSVVTSGTLATLDTTMVPDGVATVRLRVRNASGLIGEDRNVITVDNTQIITPTNNRLVAVATTPTLPIFGRFPATVVGTPLSEYKLEYAHAATPTNYVAILTANTLPPASGFLGNWPLTNVPDGAVKLRLTVRHGTYSSSDEVTVIVDQYLKPGWPATVGHNGLFMGGDGYVSGYAFKSPIVADLDRNGSNEIIYGASVLQTNGTLRPGWTAQPGLGRTNPVVLDVDQNGTLEVVAAVFTQWYSNPGYTNEPNYGAPVIYAYDHNKSVRWSYPVDNPASGPGYDSGLPSSLSAGDVDGDGQMEIVFSIWFNYTNTPPWQTTVFVLDAATGAVEQRFTVNGYVASSIALGNLDSDAALELVVSSYLNTNGPNGDEGVAYVLNANGSNVAGWPQPLAHEYGAHSTDPVVGDVNGDGQLEVLIGRNLWSKDGTAYPGWSAAYFSQSTGAFTQLDTDSALEIILGGGNHVLYWGMDDTGANLAVNWKSDENLYEFIAGENDAPGVPILADLNGDGKADILRPSQLGYTDGRPGKLYGAEPSVSGSSLPGFPRYVNSPRWGIIRSSAVVDDIDCDGKTDMLVAGGDQIYAWNLNTPFNRANNPWPTFQHDRLHTGNYHATVDSMSACDLPSTPGVSVVEVWTDVDGSGTRGTTFSQGALINYRTHTSNTTGSLQVVSGVLSAIGPCGSILTQNSPNWQLTPGSLFWYTHSMVPSNACPGVYTFTASIQYQGITSSKSHRFTVVAATGAILAPNKLAASTLSESQLLLTWADRANNELGFRLERCQVASGTACNTFVQIATVDANVTTFTDAERMANTRYCYRVRGYNHNRVSSYTNVACRTTAPPPPTGLTGQTLSKTQIKLTWIDNATNESGFKIERCQGNGCTNFSQIATRAANITTFTNGSLTANTTYCYRVRAYNANGNTSYSNTICPKTLALALGSNAASTEETAADHEGTPIAVATPIALQLLPASQQILTHDVTCLNNATAANVVLWAGEVAMAMQSDATQSRRYQAVIDAQGQFTAAATYPLVVQWICADMAETFEELVGTLTVTDAAGVPLNKQFFLPLVNK